MTTQKLSSALRALGIPCSTKESLIERLRAARSLALGSGVESRPNNGGSDQTQNGSEDAAAVAAQKQVTAAAAQLGAADGQLASQTTVTTTADSADSAESAIEKTLENLLSDPLLCARLIDKLASDDDRLNSSLPSVGEKKGVDPWLAAATIASGVTYPSNLTLSFGDRRCVLDPFLWPALILRTGLSNAESLRSSLGLRTRSAEDIFQIWRQLHGASEEEASSLMDAMEQIQLCLISHADKEKPGSFFIRHSQRFTAALKLAKNLEVRMIRRVDPLIARQVAIRGEIGVLPLSAGTAEIAMKAKIDLAKGNTPRSKQSEKRIRKDESPRTCKYCHESVEENVSFFKHFKVCKKAKDAKDSKPASKI